MKIPTGRIEAFLLRPEPAVRIFLFFGPDQGQVSNRAAGLISQRLGPARQDPFRYASLSPARAAADPALLADEMASQSLTGGCRLVHLRGADDAVAPALQAVLQSLPAALGGDSWLVIEADDLSPRSLLRKLCEADDKAAALGCYAESGDALARRLRQLLAAGQQQIDDDALHLLVGALPPDQRAQRAELDKLQLYCHGQPRIRRSDVRAIIADTAEADWDMLALAFAAGDGPALLRACDRLGETLVPVAAVRAVARHLLRLETCLLRMAEGLDAKGAMQTLRPPVFFKQEAAFHQQLRRWQLPHLAWLRQRLLTLEAQLKRSGIPDRVLLQEQLLSLATHSLPRPNAAPPTQ